MSSELPKVLVVDDERFFREAITEILSQAEIDSETAQDGREALQKIEDMRFGVVVLDIEMPGMDGIEVLRLLREIRPSVRVIILSSHTEQEKVLEALRAGAADYLAKPIHDEELVLAVNRAIENYGVIEGSSRLRTRLRALESRIAALAGLAGMLGGEDALKGIGNSAAEAVAEVLGAAKTSLLLIDDEGDELRVLAAVGRDLSPTDFDPVRVGDPVAGKVYVSGEPLLVPDVRDDARFQESDRYRAHSFVATPVAIKQEVMGVLCATDRIGGGAFDELDLALMHILSLQVAQLLSKAHANPSLGETQYLIVDDEDQTMEVEIAELDVSGPGDVVVVAEDDVDAELARRVCEALSSEVEPSSILESVLAPVAEILKATPASIYLFNAEKKALVLEAQTGEEDRKDRRALPEDKGLTGVVFQTGQPVATDRPQADPRFRAAVDTPVDGKDGPFFCLPVSFRGKVLGVFRGFPASDGMTSPRTGEVLGAALSAAVRNVLLYRSLVESMDEVATIRRETQGED